MGDNCMPGTQFNPEPGLLHCLIIIGRSNKLWHKGADRGPVITVRLRQSQPGIEADQGLHWVVVEASTHWEHVGHDAAGRSG